MAHLLLLTERFPPDIGGVARSAGRIAASLSQLAVPQLQSSPSSLRVTVLTWSRYLSPGELAPPEVLETSQVTVYRLGLYRHWDMTLPQTLNVLDGLFGAPDPPTLIWGHYLFPAGFVAAYYGKLRGLSSVVSARGNDIDRAMFPPGDFARLQWTLTHASVVTAVSQDMVRKIDILSGCPAQLHHNVVDTQIFQMAPTSDQAVQSRAELKAELGIEPQECVLGFSGELREKKGQQFLLQALLQVQTVQPACLLIIGRLRTESQTLLQTFRSQDPAAAERIIVTDHLEGPEQVAQHLQICDIYLQPSLWEGMPNALLEAMACGCVCIASDAGGIPEVLTSGQQGFILPRSQLHRLGDAVLDVLTLANAEREQIGCNARSHICQHYSLAHERDFLKHLLSQSCFSAAIGE
ncbi:MAG: glycosyltransferase family 4 protein [Thainema sp.]